MDESSEKLTKPVNSKEVNHKLTRRGFLRTVIRAGLVAAGLAGGGISPGAVRPRPPILSESGIPIPEVLPPDILTEEDLTKNHIKIEYSSKDPGVKLFLRKSVLDLLPVFQDARDGKIPGLVITLMNTVCWNEIYKLSEESRSLAETFLPIPPQFDEDLLGTRKQELEDYLSETKDPIEVKKLLEEFNAMDIESIKEKILNMPVVPQSARYIPPQTPDNIYKNAQNNLKVRNWVMKHPDWAAKARIWLATGDPNESHPEGSFPSPDKYIVTPPDDQGYHIGLFQPRGEGNPVPGDIETYPSVRSYVFRHEASHYERGPGAARSEYEADESAYNSLIAAWNKFQESGDTSGYPFYFVDKQGRISVAQKSSPNIKNV